MSIFSKLSNIITRRKSYYGLWQSQGLRTDATWDGKDFLSAYEISLYTNRALTKRAEKVGQTKFILKNSREEIVQKHKILDLLYKPNNLFSGVEFWKLYQLYKDTTGAAFLLKIMQTPGIFEEKIPTELHLLLPDNTKVVMNESGTEIAKFEYYKFSGGMYEYQPEEVLYSHHPNLRSPMQRQSILTAGRAAISLETQVRSYQDSILRNGGRVEDLFKVKGERLSKEQLEHLKDTYKEQHAEAKRAGLPLFIPAESMEYIQMGLKPAELAYLETKGTTLDDICILTGVPKTILGLTSGETFANADAAIRVFLQETIKPLNDDLCEKLNEFLVPKELELTYEDLTPEDKENKRKDMETADRVHALTINEQRAMIGFEPIKGGDSIVVPFNLVPFDGQENKPAPAKSKQADEFKHPLRDYEFRRKYEKKELAKDDRNEARFVRILNGYFNGQRDRLIDKLQPVKDYRRKDLLDDSFNMQIEVRFAFDKIRPLMEALLIEAGMDALELIGSDYEFNVGADALIFLDGKAQAYADSINATTFSKLKEEFVASLDANETRPELIKRIKNTYENIKTSRAATIARTEVHGITEYGKFNGYKQAGTPIKIWVAVMDSQTRDSHAALDGEERPIDTPFSNGLMMPGDNRGPAEEVINCRCKI